MPAKRLHLIRHGEVHNPGSVIYGRLPHFKLSDLGHQMAAAAAAELKKQERQVGKIFASPLLRTQESAQHVEKAFGVDTKTDERLIEPWNRFEGRKFGATHLLLRPHLFITCASRHSQAGENHSRRSPQECWNQWITPGMKPSTPMLY